MKSIQSRRVIEMVMFALSVIVGLGLIVSIVQTELMSTHRPIQTVPIPLAASQHANYAAEPLPIRIAPARVQIIAEAIRDQDAHTDAVARMATVEANLLTPVPSLLGPTATCTPTLTPTRLPTATPTLTPTRAPVDPWVLIGQVTVDCGREVFFEPVYAQKIKFVIVAGGGRDNHVSYYCCGSNGTTWLINGTWQPLFARAETLNVGEVRESENLNGLWLSRARFYLGCNDREPASVYLFYLPMPPPSRTPTATR